MNIQFENGKLEKLCNDNKALRKEFGNDMATKITLRLAALKAANCLEDCRNIPGKFHNLGSDRKFQIGVSVSAKDRLILAPTENPPPLLNDGATLDWNNIKSVIVLEITNYHKKK